MEIRLLPESAIDKIAAGEVVERPANVVKELVENAIDSGADAVTVEIKEGGISLIRVTDNGSGIEKSQVQNAFLRHATSKIRDEKDLLNLSSLGFRGEALSSICAVAQVEMITKTEKELTGVRFLTEGGVQKGREEIGAPKGTTVLVRNLFFNVPVRKKFLRTAQTEAGYISDLMERLALFNPRLSFKYVCNGQVKFHTSGNGNLKEIIYRIYGREITNELLWMSAEENGTKIEGFLGTPVIGRANRNFENYCINGRYIKSEIISRAVEYAYKPYLMQHKYPFFVLHFTMDGDMVDVNVHPAKMEVRFHEQMAFSDFVFRAVKDALSKKEMLKEIVFSEEKGKKDKKEVPMSVRVPEPFETQARKMQTDFSESEDMAVKMQAFGNVSRVEEPGIYNRIVHPINDGDGQAEAQKNKSNIIKKEAHILVEKPVQMNFFDEKLLSVELRDEYRVVGQMFDTYWIVELGDKMFFIDQHAAHEKVKYEKLCKRIKEDSVVSQNLNPPVILTLSGGEEQILNEYSDYFKQIGFEAESFGGNEYALRAVPADIFGRDAKEMFKEILDELHAGPIKGESEVIAAKLASMACKAAVKGNMRLSSAEAESLIDELLKLDNPYHCPHGRPTIITMTKHELEKKFSRIVT